MCNGESSRVSCGGTIAILKPVSVSSTAESESAPASAPSTSRTSIERELSLRLIDDAGQTRAIIHGLPFTPGCDDGHFIVHRDGDLSSLQPLDGAASILHKFSVPPTAQQEFLAPPMDLGVGGNGIIGRRVSLIQNQILVGQGIIGWN